VELVFRELAKSEGNSHLSRAVVLAILAAALVQIWSTQGIAGKDEVDRGLQALRKGRVDAAIDMWTRAIKKNPKSYAAHVNRGSAYLLAGHVLRGIRDWHEAENLAPAFAYAVYEGDFIPEVNHNAEMLNFAAPLEIDPDHIASVLMMGAAYLEFGLTEEAAELYKKSVNLTSNPLLKSQLDHWLGTLDQ